MENYKINQPSLNEANENLYSFEVNAKPMDDDAHKLVLGFFKSGRPCETAIDVLVENGYSYDEASEYTNRVYGYLLSHDVVIEKEAPIKKKEEGSVLGTIISIIAIILFVIRVIVAVNRN
jgi:hypothetical protein